MAKAKKDDWKRALLVLGGVLIGTKLVEELTTPRFPCPNCRFNVKQFEASCPRCKLPLYWYR